MPKPKTFYIAHDNDALPPEGVRFYRRKPKVTSIARSPYDKFLASLCLDAFTKTTGLTLAPGETKKVQLVEVKP